MRPLEELSFGEDLPEPTEIWTDQEQYQRVPKKELRLQRHPKGRDGSVSCPCVRYSMYKEEPKCIHYPCSGSTLMNWCDHVTPHYGYRPEQSLWNSSMLCPVNDLILYFGSEVSAKSPLYLIFSGGLPSTEMLNSDIYGGLIETLIIIQYKRGTLRTSKSRKIDQRA